MAIMTQVNMVDDLDGRRAEETVCFGLDGAQYEIDLSRRNAAALRKALADFVEASRQVRAERPPKSKRLTRKASATRTMSTRAQVAAIRQWATAAGMQMATRGRISVAVLDAYSQARAEKPSILK